MYLSLHKGWAKVKMLISFSTKQSFDSFFPAKTTLCNNIKQSNFLHQSRVFFLFSNFSWAAATLFWKYEWSAHRQTTAAHNHWKQIPSCWATVTIINIFCSKDQLTSRNIDLAACRLKQTFLFVDCESGRHGDKVIPLTHWAQQWSPWHSSRSSGRSLCGKQNRAPPVWFPPRSRRSR